VLLVHPGGPLWAKRQDGAWSIPKGELEPGEDPLAAADREFAEELGAVAPAGPRLDLGQVVQASGKVVDAWAVEGDLDADTVQSNSVVLQWPPRSGQTITFPEIDRASWFTLAEARRLVNPAQAVLLDRLADRLADRSGAAGEISQPGRRGGR
jgi:predicted NUDIX family NTP pyrophosphohydrolase